MYVKIGSRHTIKTNPAATDRLIDSDGVVEDGLVFLDGLLTDGLDFTLGRCCLSTTGLAGLVVCLGAMVHSSFFKDIITYFIAFKNFHCLQQILSLLLGQFRQFFVFIYLGLINKKTDILIGFITI